mgnify:CR=1 FL=1
MHFLPILHVIIKAVFFMFLFQSPSIFPLSQKKSKSQQVYESTGQQVWGENFGNRGKSVIFAKYYLQSII